MDQADWQETAGAGAVVLNAEANKQGAGGKEKVKVPDEVGGVEVVERDAPGTVCGGMPQALSKTAARRLSYF